MRTSKRRWSWCGRSDISPCTPSSPSPRPNTLALKRLPDDVPEGDKASRIFALQSLQRDIQSEWHASLVGTAEDVLVDGVSRRRDWELAGRTGGNTVVNFAGPSEWIGRIVRVRITGAGPNSLRGEAVQPASTGARAC